MAKQTQSAISPTRAENFPEWYQQVVKAADLAENSDVRGCMVIKPWGYSIWENMQRRLDAMFKATGHENAYFPLFIPMSFLEKEAQHVEGFAKECAVVTHHRLEPDGKGGLRPAPSALLEEPLIVRPTSETIIGASFARWVQSYRDLPILINQWANVVRWELRTRLFLRTTEFLWQEGHTVHADEKEALEETMRMLDVYADFAEHTMAMPVIKGEKTEGERFPGAVSTYTIEAMMQDRKALQAGTSHFLGQNFARAQEIKYQDVNGQEVYAWTTSCAGEPIRVRIDNREMRGGDKKWQWVKRGVPIRIEIGPRDVAGGKISFGRRDVPGKLESPRAEFVALVPKMLDEIQHGLLQRAMRLRDEATVRIDSVEEFEAYFTPKNEERPEIHGGLAYSHFVESPEMDEKLKALKVTVRCVPLAGENESGRCIFTGQASGRRGVFAKSY
jgi:prolyl-tRNA synthetase